MATLSQKGRQKETLHRKRLRRTFQFDQAVYDRLVSDAKRFNVTVQFLTHVMLRQALNIELDTPTEQELWQQILARRIANANSRG